MAEHAQMSDMDGSLNAKQNDFSHLVTEKHWEAICDHFQLTIRESQVCRLTFQSKTRIEIAAELEIRPRTVRQYMEQIHKKLNITNRIALVLKIVEARDQLDTNETNQKQKSV